MQKQHLGIMKYYVKGKGGRMTNSDHIERTKRMIEVMQAYVDGEDIEYMSADGNWYLKPHRHVWSYDTEYRIAKTIDTINWDHVAPEFKYMAKDKGGFGYIYANRPSIKDDVWAADGGKVTKPENYASYRKGTVDWKESLVIRPGCE